MLDKTYFYCTYQSPDTTIRTSIPRNKVNDGVCDCCDGSDEYNDSGNKNCQNTCPDQGAWVHDLLVIGAAVGIPVVVLVPLLWYSRQSVVNKRFL